MCCVAPAWLAALWWVWLLVAVAGVGAVWCGARVLACASVLRLVLVGPLWRVAMACPCGDWDEVYGGSDAMLPP